MESEGAAIQYGLEKPMKMSYSIDSINVAPGGLDEPTLQMTGEKLPGDSPVKQVEMGWMQKANITDF